MMPLDIKSVLVVDGVAANCTEILNSNGINVTNKAKITKNILLQEIPKYDALVVSSAFQITKEVLDAGAKLKVVCIAGLEGDNIDVDAANKNGVVVIHAPRASAISTCELACTLCFCLAHHVVPAASAMREGRWDSALYTGSELYGKTLAIIGLGTVGREVAIRMHAFGMKIIAYDPFLSVEDFVKFHATKMDLDEIFLLADYITIHNPLMPSTKKFINAALQHCKKGVKIINAECAGFINAGDLLVALNSGNVGGAALDVFKQELPTDPVALEVIQHKAVITTPDLGLFTKEAQMCVGQEIAEQLVNLVKPGTYNTPLAEVTHILDQ